RRHAASLALPFRSSKADRNRTSDDERTHDHQWNGIAPSLVPDERQWKRTDRGRRDADHDGRALDPSKAVTAVNVRPGHAIDDLPRPIRHAEQQAVEDRHPRGADELH